MNCIIIDDEPKAVDILKRYAGKISFLSLLKTFRDPIDALTFIHQNPVDLIFLDINMPELSGIQLARLLDSQPLIIFTTAYSEHAIEGYELNTVDYLLKPIVFERFLKAVSKASALKVLKDNAKTDKMVIKEFTERPLFFKSGTTIHKITSNEILFLEKEANYFSLCLTNNKKLLIRMNFADIFNILPQGIFVRIHKSYIININHIEHIESDLVSINKTQFPIGASYKEDFMRIVSTTWNK